MSWTEELFRIYEYNSGREFADNEPVMLPISHSTANAQVEIVLDADGNFQTASVVDKKDAETIIPVTEASGSRSRGVAPMPFADKLIYIAGDYGKYQEMNTLDERKHPAYLGQLKRWCDSKHSHPAVKAVYAYTKKGGLVADLIGSGILKTDESMKKLLPEEKIAGIAQKDVFVRFIVLENTTPQTWLDQTLYDRFIAFNSDLMGKSRLCYATGNVEPVTYKHPTKIRHSGDKAKLFSSNDESGFSYRGRFTNKEDALSIGYVFTQKLHTALCWLIKKQGENIGSLTIITWASSMQALPSYNSKLYDDDLDDTEDSIIPSTLPLYMQMLKKRIFGYNNSIQPDTKMMIMGLDSATTGRISVSFYSEIEGSRYIRNVEKWHRDTAWRRFSGKKKSMLVNSFSLYEITKCAFGTEKGSFIDCDSDVLSDNLLRLTPCVTEERRLPNDLIASLFNKASNPLAYNNSYNHRIVLETACGMIKNSLIDKNQYDNTKGDVLMAYDPNETDRSYLFGCLLAIADTAESEAYSKEDRGVRVTNAKRYWNTFSQRPYQTWQTIEEHLRPYMTRLQKSQVKYEKWINEIMGKMAPADFTDNSRLEPLYLLGYHHFTDFMYNTNNTEKREEN